MNADPLPANAWAELQRHVDETQFLSRVGEILQSSLDYSASIEHIVRLAVGFLGDGCAVDVLGTGDTLTRMRVAHADPDLAGVAEALEHILPERDHPIWDVLETKAPLLFAEVPAELLRDIVKNDEHRRLLEQIGLQSAMLVPLIARDRLVGVLTTISCRHHYRADDVRVAVEFARRAALALDNARLYEVAQEAIRARDQVLEMVAHDLRNPLGTIMSASAILQRVSTDPQLRRPLDIIGKAGMRINRMIRDLLDVTRIEGRILAVEPRTVETHQVLVDCIEVQKELAAAARIDLRFDPDGDLPPIHADRDRLLQVFENLIGNAIKFTPPGGTIIVSARPQGQHVQFAVRDTGAGIAEADLSRLFDRFWIADHSRRGGAGLGLPIVKGIVEAHGGQIWVESTMGAGSTFYFSIPRAQ